MLKLIANRSQVCFGLTTALISCEHGQGSTFSFIRATVEAKNPQIRLRFPQAALKYPPKRSTFCLEGLLISRYRAFNFDFKPASIVCLSRVRLFYTEKFSSSREAASEHPAQVNETSSVQTYPIFRKLWCDISSGTSQTPQHGAQCNKLSLRHVFATEATNKRRSDHPSCSGTSRSRFPTVVTQGCALRSVWWHYGLLVCSRHKKYFI